MFRMHRDDVERIARAIPPPPWIPRARVKHWRELIVRVMREYRSTLDDAVWVASRAALPTDDAKKALGPRQGFRLRDGYN